MHFLALLATDTLTADPNFAGGVDSSVPGQDLGTVLLGAAEVFLFYGGAVAGWIAFSVLAFRARRHKSANKLFLTPPYAVLVASLATVAISLVAISSRPTIESSQYPACAGGELCQEAFTNQDSPFRVPGAFIAFTGIALLATGLLIAPNARISGGVIATAGATAALWSVCAIHWPDESMRWGAFGMALLLGLTIGCGTLKKLGELKSPAIKHGAYFTAAAAIALIQAIVTAGIFQDTTGIY